MHLFLLIFWILIPVKWFSFLAKSLKYLPQEVVYKSERGFPNLKIKIKSHLSNFETLGTLKPLLFVVDTVMCHPDFSSVKGLLSLSWWWCYWQSTISCQPFHVCLNYKESSGPISFPLPDDLYTMTNQHKDKKIWPSWPNLEQLWRTILVSELSVGLTMAVARPRLYLKFSLFPSPSSIP